MNNHAIWQACGILGATLLPAHALALEVDLGIEEESRYTTNTARTDDDEISEWIHAPGVSLRAEHAGPSYDLNVDYRFSREFYQEDVFDNDNITTGTAALVWRPITDRLDFVVDHSRTQSARQSIEPTTPDNRQETINTSAGPILKFRPRGQDEIQVQYMLGDRRTQDDIADATTDTAALRYILAMSPNDSLTLNASRQDVEFDTDLVPDLEYGTVTLAWERTGSTTSVRLMGGFTDVKRDQGRDDVDGNIGEIAVDWQPRPTTTLSVSATRDVRDQSVALTSGRRADDLDFAVNSDVAEVFTNTSAQFEIAQELGRSTSLSAYAIFDEEDYEDVPRDTETSTIGVQFTRQINSTTSANANISHIRQDFQDQGDESDSLRGEIGMEWNLSRDLTLSSWIRYEDRDSDSGTATRVYKEWVGAVKISYNVL